MNEKEQELGGLELEDILKEFSVPEENLSDAEQAASHDLQKMLDGGEPEEELPAEEPPAAETPEAEAAPSPISDDTIRLDDLAQVSEAAPRKEASATSETIRLDDPVEAAAETEGPIAEETAKQEEAEEFVPAAPIIFDPRARLRELKRKLVAGPEKRYYELAEVGVGKLQVAMFLCLVVIAISTGAAILYGLNMVPENRMRLMVFGQVLAMLLGALLGSYQMLEGLADLFRGKFTPNTLMTFTFFACCVDSIFCLQELRVPICGAFTLEVLMSLWSTYHRRSTEMGMMDTMRKAVRLRSVVKCADYFEGHNAIGRGEGEVEDFIDTYNQITGPEKVQNFYSLAALLISIAIAVAAGLLHGLSLGVQILSTTLLVAMPASFFVALTRPWAVLERRLHAVGTVLCGWKGVLGLSGKFAYPLNDDDLFPAGSIKMNGVKFYGDRDPETIIAYAAALMHANGGGLAPIFDQLLSSRNGIRYEAENLHFYGNGGIGGEINDEPVLMGTMEFLKDMGVEIPEGTMVKQAVYVSVDGEFSGLFAINYNRAKHIASGMATLCSSRRIRPVILAQDFLLTAPFLKEKFGLRPRRSIFPSRTQCEELASKTPDPDSPALALTTQDGLAGAAYAITGAHALRTACRLGLTVHMMGGILGLLIMAALAVLGTATLLTPIHVLLYQLVWLVPGWIVTMWTRAI